MTDKRTTFAFGFNQSSTARRTIDEQSIHQRRKRLDVGNTWRRRRNDARRILDNLCRGRNERPVESTGQKIPPKNLKKIPGNYYFARDHFHCIARRRSRAAIRGMMEHTC